MNLLLDLGNTRLKWALADGGLQAVQARLHQDRPLALFDALELPAVQSVWISAVPRLADREGWTVAVRSRCRVAPQFAQSRGEWRGLRSAYAEPERLGVDRWLAMVALWQQLHAPFLVVSAGTALTVDRVAADGRHLGGIIAPGYGSSLASLLRVTATADTIAAVTDPDALGTHSEAAIRQGALFSSLGAIDRCLRAPGGDAAERRVVTGGDAPALWPHLSGDWQSQPDLVLQGLLALATAPA